MFNLAEELLILSLPDALGKKVGMAGNISYALTGAFIIELMTRGRARLNDKKKLEITDSSSTGNELLDEVIQRIRGAKRPATAQTWIGNLALAIKRLRPRVLQPLVDKGIVRAEPKKFLGLFPYTYYFLFDPTPAMEIRERLRASLIDERAMEARTLLLVSILQASRFLTAQLPKTERKAANKKAAQLMKENAIAKAIADQNAAVAAAVIAATSAASS